MLLEDRLHNLGHRLFRFRSYTPLLAVPLLVFEAREALWSHGSVWDIPYEVGCFLVSLLGLGIRAFTTGFVPRGTSGRNTTSQRAEVLNTTGMYSMVRNPLYLGNYLVFLGVTLLSQSWQLAMINSVLCLAAYVPIILVEERFLLQTFGRPYRRYAAKVPCLWPAPRRWKAPRQPWSWKMVLRRENDSFFSTVLAFAIIEHVRESAMAGEFRCDGLWLGVAGGAAAVWSVLKYLKRCTPVLKLVPVPRPLDRP